MIDLEISYCRSIETFDIDYINFLSIVFNSYQSNFLPVFQELKYLVILLCKVTGSLRRMHEIII